MPSRSERRAGAWTALAAEPAVRAAERAIATRSAAVLADTLAISTAAESRRRLARVLELRDRADDDLRTRDEYQRAADELRAWAAQMYLAAQRTPDVPTTPPVRHENPHTEESVSLRRLASRPPFPGQRRRHAFDATGPPGRVRAAGR